MLGSAKSERPKLTNGDIILEEFQLRYLNVTDRRTDRRLCRSNTALCIASRGNQQGIRVAGS